MARAHQFVGFLVAERMVNQCFKDIAGDRAFKTKRFSTGNTPFNDFTLALVMAQGQACLQFVFTDGGDHRLALCNQVNDVSVNLVKPLAILEQLTGCQC